VSDEQLENTWRSRSLRNDPHSNVIADRRPHSPKQAGPICPTDEGTQIRGSDEHLRKADSPIRESFESTSNTTIERDSHSEKHESSSSSTDEGMQIDESNEQCQNEKSAKRAIRDPDSNSTEMRCVA
jgi:hypothetical protein